MVIKRTFKLSADPARDRRRLGRVQVAIDDLAVLIEILRTRGGATREDRDATTGDIVQVPYDEPVTVEFDEGEFTDAEDVRQLSDANLREIRVKSGDTTVHLSPFRAEALGPTQLNDLIENIWARSRQTKKRPSGWPIMLWYAAGLAVAAVSLVVTIGVLMLAGLPGLSQLLKPPLLWSTIPVITAGAILMTIMARLILDPGSGKDRSNYAVIIALSLDELRKQERGRNKWQNVSGVVGIISLIVAITVAVVNRLIPMS